MIKQRSAGIIIFSRNQLAIRYLLLHHGGQYWNFPKGRLESDEDELTAARRELAEETGITDVALIKDFQAGHDYAFESHIKGGIREKVSKHVTFFLGEVTAEKVAISSEHLDYGWFDYETALKRLFYQNGQNVLKQAHQCLLKKQDFVL